MCVSLLERNGAKCVSVLSSYVEKHQAKTGVIKVDQDSSWYVGSATASIFARYVPLFTQLIHDYNNVVNFRAQVFYSNFLQSGRRGVIFRIGSTNVSGDFLC